MCDIGDLAIDLNYEIRRNEMNQSEKIIYFVEENNWTIFVKCVIRSRTKWILKLNQNWTIFPRDSFVNEWT